VKRQTSRNKQQNDHNDDDDNEPAHEVGVPSDVIGARSKALIVVGCVAGGASNTVSPARRTAGPASLTVVVRGFIFAPGRIEDCPLPGA
jgi:hypothetical protein